MPLVCKGCTQGYGAVSIVRTTYIFKYGFDQVPRAKSQCGTVEAYEKTKPEFRCSYDKYNYCAKKCGYILKDISPKPHCPNCGGMLRKKSREHRKNRKYVPL